MAQRVKSGKGSAAAAGRSAAATSHQHWTDGETMSTFHSQPPSRNAVGRLLGSTWRYRWLIAAAVLLGALLGSGWAARQPTLYQGVTRVLMTASSTSLPGDVLPQLPVDPGQYLRQQAQLMRSAPVLQRTVKLTHNRISAETLRQRLEVDAAKDADVLTIRVVDSTATGAAQLADAVAAAYDQVVARRSHEVATQLLRARSEQLKTRLAEAEAELARNPNDRRLRAECRVLTDQDREVLEQLRALERSRPVLAWERAAVPKQPISPSPGRAMVIGMLLGLLAAAVLVWWLTRRQGPTSKSSAPEQAPETPPS
jgi:uncharacterized protein involved in exopolysaccharide biosynthesis